MSLCACVCLFKFKHAPKLHENSGTVVTALTGTTAAAHLFLWTNKVGNSSKASLQRPNLGKQTNKQKTDIQTAKKGYENSKPTK